MSLKEDQENLVNLIDKEVYIEVQATGNGDYSTSAKTMLYWGIFKGISHLGSMEMVLLENAEHYNRASIRFPRKKGEKTVKMESKYSFINQRYILSIDLKEPEK